jgi:hypothetical protein
LGAVLLDRLGVSSHDLLSGFRLCRQAKRRPNF